VALIKSIPIRAAERAQALVQEAALTGKRASEIAEELMKTTRVSESNAKRIARTEVARSNAALTEARALHAGSDSYIWRTTMDGAERESHAKMNGKTVLYKSPPTLIDGTRGHAGTFPNCFPGDSELTGTPLVKRIYRRNFKGDLVTLFFDDGGRLSATPNHPILGGDGIQPIKNFNIGHELIVSAENIYPAANKHVDRFDVSFQKLFHAFNVNTVLTRSCQIGGNFHGDRSNEEVDIITSDSSLIEKGDAIAREKMFKLGFTQTDKAAILETVFSDSSFRQLGVTSFSTPNDVMGRLNLCLSLLRAHLTPFEFFSFMLVSQRDVPFTHPSGYGEARDSKGFGDLINAYAFLIHGYDFIDWKLKVSISRTEAFPSRRIYAENAQLHAQEIRTNFEFFRNGSKSLTGGYSIRSVVDKHISEFSGHVYNLETVSGYYIAQKTPSGNCRCYQEPQFNSDP
jgi:SPP1 gp7 family putative phage head morphogenesis protein